MSVADGSVDWILNERMLSVSPHRGVKVDLCFHHPNRPSCSEKEVAGKAPIRKKVSLGTCLIKKNEKTFRIHLQLVSIKEFKRALQSLQPRNTYVARHIRLIEHAREEELHAYSVAAEGEEAIELMSVWTGWAD